MMNATAMRTIAVSAVTLGLALPASGKNVDVSTLPNRDTVQLTIYNAEDLTLVRETRRITFRRGMNPLQFSWANTLIDPTSVDLRFASHGTKLDVLDTTYPHDKPQMLYWNVRSELDGEAVVEITYFTSGITWTLSSRARFARSSTSRCSSSDRRLADKLKSFVRSRPPSWM